MFHFFFLFAFSFNGTHGLLNITEFGNYSVALVTVNGNTFNVTFPSSQGPFLPVGEVNISIPQALDNFTGGRNGFSGGPPGLLLGGVTNLSAGRIIITPQGNTTVTLMGKKYGAVIENIEVMNGSRVIETRATLFQDGLIYNLSQGGLHVQLVQTNYPIPGQITLNPIPLYISASAVGLTIVGLFIGRRLRSRSKGQSRGDRPPYWVE